MTEKLCDACDDQSADDYAFGGGYSFNGSSWFSLCRPCIRDAKAAPEAVQQAIESRWLERRREPAPLAVGQTVDPRVLPTYDQIAGWLGAEWVMMLSTWLESAPLEWPTASWPSPWYRALPSKQFTCYLRHTPTGQRVKVTAPHGEMAEELWRCWFGRISRGVRKGMGQFYHAQVRWLDPLSLPTSESPSRELMSSRSERRAPSSAGSATVRCAHCHTPALPNGTRGCKPGCEPKATEPRWPNTPAEHHARLDRMLAAQVASGGQDCKAAWSLIERADRLRREAEENRRSVELLSPDRDSCARGVHLATQARPPAHLVQEGTVKRG